MEKLKTRFHNPSVETNYYVVAQILNIKTQHGAARPPKIVP
jgi:hypothetical protein